MGVHPGRTLGDRLGEPHRIDDGRVVERVGKDDVAFFSDRCGEALVGIPAGDITECRLRSHEARECLLQFPMNRECAANKSYTSGAGAEGLQALDPGIHHVGLVAKSEVIVGREDEYVSPTFHLYVRGLRRGEVVEPLVDLVVLQLLDRGLERRYEVLVDHDFTWSWHCRCGGNPC